MSDRLNDKVILVTGASRGLGRLLVERFARSGAALAFCSRQSDELAVLEAECHALGAKAQALPCDLRNEDEIIRMVHRVFDRYRRIDVVVNAASVRGPRLPISAHPLEPWDAVLRTNLTGTYLVCREVVPYMNRAGRGLIVNIASAAPPAPGAFGGAFWASQSGVEGLSRILADELSPRGIRVLTVDPELPDELTAESCAGCLDGFVRLAGSDADEFAGLHLRASELVSTRPSATIH